MNSGIKSLILVPLALSLPTLAVAEQPVIDYEASTYWIEVAVPVSVFCLPDGTGDRLDEAQIFGGGAADATIHLYLVDEDGNIPMFGFPADYMLLVGSPESTFHPCPDGTTADADIDVNGRTTWTGPQGAGGSIDAAGGELLWLMVDDVTDWGPGLAISMNSADINGDRAIDLTDIGLFAQDYYGTYDYRSDFVWDGVLNLSDVGRLAAAMGAGCPER